MWDNRFWSHQVHERFKERLYYYFVQVRSFDEQVVKREVERIASICKLGSIRCYSVFGQHDLIIRVWLPPALSDYFPKQLLKSNLEIKELRQFNVREIPHIWYDSRSSKPSHKQQELLRWINEKNIETIEAEVNGALLERLIDENLVLEAPEPGKKIKFFVAVDLSGENVNLVHEIAREAIHFCYAQQEYSNIACYTGFGHDCAVLIKAQAISFFNISALPLFIAKRFPTARTETFISLKNDFLFGTGRIGQAAIQAMQNRSIAVLNIIPEVYDNQDSDEDRNRRARQIVAYVDSELGDLDLAPKKFDLIQKYLLAYLEGRTSEMAGVLFDFFVSLEEYLRRNLLTFIGRACGNKKAGQVWKRVGIDRSEVIINAEEADHDKSGNKKFLVLGEFLRLYEAAAEIAPEYDPEDAKIRNWQALVKLRNQVAHGSLSTKGEGWKAPIVLILECYWPIRRLISVIAACTGQEFDSRFL